MNTPPSLPPNHQDQQSQGLSQKTQQLLDEEMQHLPPQYHQGYFALLNQPRQCDAGRGIAWLIQAWKLFKSQWLTWLLVFWAFTIVFAILGVIPIVNILITFLSFHTIGGFMLMAAEQANGRDFGFETFLSAFTKHFLPLLLLCVVFFGMVLVTLMVFGFIGFVGLSVMDAEINGIMAETFTAEKGLAWLGFMLLGGMFVMLLLLMATWFAPALIVLHGVKVIDAMKMSFKGCAKNVLPFLVYGLGGVVVGVILILTLGLALIPLAPIMTLAYYTSYRDVWTEEMLQLS